MIAGYLPYTNEIGKPSFLISLVNKNGLVHKNG